jgi:hypothetical protein
MKSKEIWNDQDWASRRTECRRLELWYEGVPLDATEPKADPETGEKVRRFPLRLNLNALACDVHRDYSRGEVPDDPLFVKATVVRGDDPARADVIEKTINEKIWRKSFGGAILQEALLAMNIFGGTVFKLSMEPWDIDLPLGIGVRHIRNPSLIKPTWDFLNPWRMLECYFGYEITSDVARAKYGVTVPENKLALYMEHWTRSEWKITVNDIVPKMSAGDNSWELKGKNSWGVVPFYYVPHERATEPWGKSQIAGREHLNLEVNARTVGVSDMVRNIRHNLLWATDLRMDPSVRTVEPEGQPPITIIDMGGTSGPAGAKPPTLNSMPTADIPQYYAQWPRSLLELWMQFDRVSPATFGMDDTQSGRITGPAVAQRVWTSTSHAATERLYLTTAKTLLDGDIVHILSEPVVRKALEKAGKKVPDIRVEDRERTIMQTWPPSLPLDRMEKHRESLEKLSAGGISPERYLDQIGVVDAEEEMARIYEHKEKMAEIESVKPPTPFGGGPVKRPQD